VDVLDRIGAGSRGQQAIALPSQDDAQVQESHRVPGVCSQGPGWQKHLPGPGPFFLISHSQGHTCVQVLGRDLQAEVQQLYAIVEQAEVHIA
jgi:hypothetical protein